VVVRGLRALGRTVFGYRRPANLRLSTRGLELDQRTELLGRVLRQRSLLVPLGQIARITREVRYARASLYAGLVALVLGSYFGTGMLVDGLRVPGTSPPLLGLSVLLIAAGLVLDFGLSAWSDSSASTCRVVVVPRAGRAWCIARVDVQRADAILASVARQASLPAPETASSPNTRN
jgi:hypothetical protein